MKSDTTQEGHDDLNYDVFDESLDEDNLHEDYLLDAEYAENVPKKDFTPFGWSSSDDLSSEDHYSDLKENDIGADELSETSTASVRRNGTQTKNSMKSQTSNSYYDIKKSNEYDMRYTHGLSFMGSSFLPTNFQYNNFPLGQCVKRKRSAVRKVSATNCFEASKVGNLLTEKRLHKPTKRYMDEVSELRSENMKAKQKCFTSPKDKRANVKCRTNLDLMGFKSLRRVSYKNDMDKASMQKKQSDFKASEACSVRYASTSGYSSEEEPYTEETEDDYEYETTVRSPKVDDRRKNQRMWTLSEVVKLVDGISHHGVGRWTEIKRLLFASSAYRTPIDLRDKWRNLLRACNSWVQKGGEDEQKKKHASRPLPTAILHRVNELANIYPYPKARSSNDTKVARKAVRR